LKILHLSKYYHPFRGGIEKVIKDLSEGMVQRGHQVRVLSSAENNQARQDWVNDVEVFRIPRWGVLYSQPLVVPLFWQLAQHMEWADIVHLHAPNPLAELAYLTTLKSKPTITTYHCDVVRQRRLMKIYGPIQQKVLAKSNGIVVSTPNHLKYSKALEEHKKKSLIVPFGVKGSHAKKSMELNHHIKKIKDKHGDYFLFIGRLVPYKGIDVLLKAMVSSNPNARLVCIGKGPRWEIWNQLAVDLGVKDRVEFLGQVDSELEFAAYIHGCHSLVLPSVDESEAFGIVQIEAMSCGKPVITTQLKSGVSWVNADNISGLSIPPRDSEALTKALDLLFENHNLRARLGEGARDRYRKLFQWETMITGYEQIYKAVLGIPDEFDIPKVA